MYKTKKNLARVLVATLCALIVLGVLSTSFVAFAMDADYVTEEPMNAGYPEIEEIATDLAPTEPIEVEPTGASLPMLVTSSCLPEFLPTPSEVEEILIPCNAESTPDYSTGYGESGYDFWQNGPDQDTGFSVDYDEDGHDDWDASKPGQDLSSDEGTAFCLSYSDSYVDCWECPTQDFLSYNPVVRLVVDLYFPDEAVNLVFDSSEYWMQISKVGDPFSNMLLLNWSCSEDCSEDDFQVIYWSNVALTIYAEESRYTPPVNDYGWDVPEFWWIADAAAEANEFLGQDVFSNFAII